MSLATFTLIHVLISLVGIVAGLVVVYGFLNAQSCEIWTAIFFITTIFTSASGFAFPTEQLLPSHKVGILSLVLLAISFAARYAFHLQNGWRKTYISTAISALYLNVFVGVVQSFQKVPALSVLAPTQSEPPFAIAQGAVLLLFLFLGYLSVKKYRAVTPA